MVWLDDVVAGSKEKSVTISPKTNTEKSRMLRKKRLEKGLKELRGVWVPVDQEKQLKKLVRDNVNKDLEK